MTARSDASSENGRNFIFVLASQAALTLRTIRNGSEHMFKKSSEMHIGNIFPIYSLLRRKVLIPAALEKMKRQKVWSFVKSLKNDAFGINTLRENGILKTDTLDKANICNRQFLSAFTRESDPKIPSKGTSPFTPMGEFTVDPNGVLKLLNNLKIHKATGPDGLSARVLKECCSEIAPILALIYNESLAQGTVPDDWRQVNVAPIFKKGEKYDAANYRPVSLTCICCKTLEHIIVSNINKHLAFESILADSTVSMVSEVRGLAKPNWFNSSMIWSAIWIVH